MNGKSAPACVGAIAVVGMGCRFPQANGVDRFWSLLQDNRDAITAVPSDRFDIDDHYAAGAGTPGKTNSRHGGFLDDVFSFDAGFFGISPAEARAMDPQQRLLLHCAWEALEDAAIRPADLAGTRTGVFVGQATSDYGDLPQPLAERGVHDSAGRRIRAVTAGRLSYALDLRGPSMVTDTACSSSLVAVHAARLSVLSGESDVAIAAGVNVILAPDDAVAYSQGGMLAADGRCKFADARGDGFVRSEGVGVVVFKRLEDAVRDRDTVQAVLLGSAVTNDGRASGFLLRPAVDGQRQMLREAWRSAGITPGDLAYVEAHGTGTTAGDEVELSALAAEMSGQRPEGRPLLTGSVKTNIGHTEAAAGIAGLIKAVLMARHGLVPASLHYTQPHRLLAGGGQSIEVVARNRPLPEAGRPALLGVSSFGLSGTNAHVVVGQYVPEAAQTPGYEPAEGAASGPQLLVLSARSPAALRRLALSYAEHLGDGERGRRQRLRDICATAACRRDSHPYRLWAVGDDHSELEAVLRSLASGEPTPLGGVGEQPVTGTVRTAFVFPGQGSQRPGMGDELRVAWPEFAQALRDCDEAVLKEAGWSPADVLAERRELRGVETVQPVLWAVEVALAEAWRRRGIEPDVCIGHSMGEIAAAHVAGALSRTDAAAVICRRSRLMMRRSGRGAMLVVALPAEEAEALAAHHGTGVVLAVENSPSSSVLAGAPDALEAIADGLRSRGVFCRTVKVDVASHSPDMDALRDDVLAALADVCPGPFTGEMVSTVHRRPPAGTELDAGYWMDNLRRPVRFTHAVASVAERGAHVFLEISPHPALTGAVEETLAASGAPARVVGSLHRDRPEAVSMACTAGRMFVHGTRVDWHRWYGEDVRRVPLPLYPWDAENYRQRPALPDAAPDGRRTCRSAVGFRGGASVRGLTPLPALSGILAGLGLPALDGSIHVLEDVSFGAELVETGTVRQLRTSWSAPEADGVRETSVDALVTDDAECSAVPVLRARLRSVPYEGAPEAGGPLVAALTRCTRLMGPAAFQRHALLCGFRIPDVLLGVRELRHGSREVVARMTRPAVPLTLAWETVLQPLLALHSGGGPFRTARHAYVPTAVESVCIHDELPGEFWVMARFTGDGTRGRERADVLVTGYDRQVLAEFRGVTLHRLPPAARTRDLMRAAEFPGRLLRRMRGGTAGRPAPRTLEARPPRPAAPTAPPDRGVAVPSTVPPAAPSGAEGVVREAAGLLGLPADRIDRARSLRELGLDSVMATQLRRRLQATHGLEVPVDLLLGADSIEALLGELTACRTADVTADHEYTGDQLCSLV
ncbi:type I polyketide synthase [Streptomyces sp. NPDC002536]